MRVFSGLEIGETLRDAIRRSWMEMDEHLRKAVRSVDPRNWHLTLFFYGEIDERMLADIYDVYDSVVDRFAPIGVTLGRWGGFPNARRARVIWAGLSTGNEEIRELKNALDEAHKRRHIPYDEKAFHPHITVARAKHKPVQIDEKQLPSETDTLVTIAVYRSTLTRAGAIYEVLRKYTLELEGKIDGKEPTLRSV